MRRIWIFGIISFCLIARNGQFAQAQETGGQKMILKERLFDVGEVKEGKIIRHTFEVLNQGDETLSIIKVEPG